MKLGSKAARRQLATLRRTLEAHSNVVLAQQVPSPVRYTGSQGWANLKADILADQQEAERRRYHKRSLHLPPGEGEMRKKLRWEKPTCP